MPRTRHRNTTYVYRAEHIRLYNSTLTAPRLVARPFRLFYYFLRPVLIPFRRGYFVFANRAVKDVK